MMKQFVRALGYSIGQLICLRSLPFCIHVQTSICGYHFPPLPYIELTLFPKLDPGLCPSLRPAQGPGLGHGLGPSLGPSLDPGLDPSLDPRLDPGLDPDLGPGLGPGLGPYKKNQNLKHGCKISDQL